MDNDKVTDQARRVPRVLSIAGSDSGGGAGIQADLKAFARCGVHGMTAITAVTWQNTVGVEGVTPIPGAAIVGQVRAVAEDIGVDAVKIGMLGTVETIEAVGSALELVGSAPVVLDPAMGAESGAWLPDSDPEDALRGLLLAWGLVVTPNSLVGGAPMVLDPVRVAGGGARLLDSGAEDALRELLRPRVTVVTPNLLEARALTGAVSKARPATPVGGSALSAGGTEPSTAGTRAG